MQIQTKMKRKIFTITTFIILFFGCTNHSEIQIHSEDPLERLIEGNKRFISGKAVHSDETPERLKQVKEKQTPFVVVVSCSDSRVPPELVFDQGFGDIFSVRTAGNIIGDYELGSIEYALENLDCKLVVVLGHEKCGAIHAFLHPDSSHKPDHINDILNYIAAEKEEQQIPADSLLAHQELAIEANILHGVHFLKTAGPVVSDLFAKNKIKIIGAIYDMDTGKVHLLDDKTESDFVK